MKAAGELLERDGLATVTIEAIAAQAGVSKATIYRWWPNKAAVITDSFLELIAPQIEFVETGSIREDLRLQMRRLAQVFASKSGRVIAALVAEGHDDAKVSSAFLTHWIAVRRRATRQVLERGIAQGELRSDLDVDVAMDALYGPIYYRLLVHHLPLDEGFTDKLADHVLRGLGVSPTTQPNL
ncbi:MAG: TetR/AcrR family transcriptional regulator [Chloroflexi bacterium]|nr:TetR/AcrR family transcriptional regulator [Chloroflexota bacterium]